MNSMWNVRGVGEEARRVAKVAAAAAGTTVGAWIENAIAKQAGAEGKKIAETVANKDGVAVGGKADRGPNQERRIQQMTGVGADDVIAEGQGIGALLPPVTPIRRKKTKAVKVCAHGTMAGNNCWQCGGKAAVQ